MTNFKSLWTCVSIQKYIQKDIVSESKIQKYIQKDIVSAAGGCRVKSIQFSL